MCLAYFKGKFHQMMMNRLTAWACATKYHDMATKVRIDIYIIQ